MLSGLMILTESRPVLHTELSPYFSQKSCPFSVFEAARFRRCTGPDHRFRDTTSITRNP